MICFTVITDGYDELKDPAIISEGWQYIVFSDRFIESDIWQCQVTEKHNRDVKIRAHKNLFHTPCLYVDGSIEIIGDLNKFIYEVPKTFSIWKHPHRDCVYKEAKAVQRLKGGDPYLLKLQMDRFRRNGFPDNFGLGANGIMFRDLSNENVRDICDMWWREFKKGEQRDQLSLMYVFYRMGTYPYLFNNRVMNKYFKWGSHI